ncbi:MAG: LysR family transcriptional regulator [Coriobacteriia bacterium]|nr:LysR family transcriptional regulator [Coriobacteriia bacterium]MCL2750322.1 LysR family transcriptional regulator [Coriobacteriia bacterium]
MNISQLQYFIKTAQLQQYTKAAEALFVSQSALSSSIAKLEDELGVELFERRGRNVQLTKAGSEFYSFGVKALDALEEGQQAVRKYKSLKINTLRIGTVDSFQTLHLTELLNAYSNQRVSESSIEITQGVTSTLVSGIVDEAFDFAFCAYPIEVPNIHYTPILQRKLAVVMSKEHSLSGLRYLRATDLLNHRIITYDTSTPLGKNVNDLLSKEKLRPSVVVDNEASLLSLVEIDTGAVGLVLSPLGTHLAEELTTVTMVDIPEDFFPILLAYKTSKKRSSDEELFIRLASGSFS